MLQGKTDIPLNEDGRRMAAEAAKEYAEIPFDICFCSPLVRAKETAEILLRGRDVPVEYDDRLMEMSFGVYEGVKSSFDIPDCPVNEFFFHPESYDDPVEGGESTRDLMERTGSFLREKVYPRLERGEDVLIVGHGAMNCALTCHIRGYDLSHFWDGMTDNCKLVRLK